MERTDNHTFYFISEYMPYVVDNIYLNINSLPIIRKLSIETRENGCGLDVKIISKTSLSIYDIIQHNVMFYNDYNDAERVLNLIKSHGYDDAFLVKLQLNATYTTQLS